MDLIVTEEVAEAPMTVLPEARQKLMKFYKPFNDELHMLDSLTGGNNKFLEWND